tara:strand:+ start:10649 stop:11281 length:633 start_codon:yes stop_codon:yes gene_type:complete
MSKKWTEASPENEAIVDYKEFNAGFNAYKSSFNGDLDRTVLPEDTFTNTQKVTGAMHKITINNSDDMYTKSVLVDATTGSLGEWRGLSYNTYTGGWVEIDSVSVDKFKDGMCHWEYRFHYLVDIFLGNTDASSLKFLEVKLEWDGVAVMESSRICSAIGTIRLVADFPTSGGTHIAKVFVRSVAPSDTEVFDNNLINITGPSHLFIGRWR